MIANLTLSLGRLRPVRIRELQESALCLSYDQRGVHILVQHSERGFVAVFLNGEYAFRSFNIEVTHDWKGLALTDYDLVVDVSSAFDSENQWSVPGTITIGSDGAELGVTVKDHHGFTDEARLKIDVGVPDVAPTLRAGFRRWAFRIREGEEFQFIWIDAGTNEKGL